MPPLGLGNFHPFIFAEMHMATAGEAIVFFFVFTMVTEPAVEIVHSMITFPDKFGLSNKFFS